MRSKLIFSLCLFLLVVLTAVSVPGAEKSPWQEIEPVPPGKEEAAVSGRTVNRILAQVTDEAITLNDYREQYGDTEVTGEKLKLLIEKELIQAAADELKINIDDDRLQKLAKQRIGRLKQAEGIESYHRYLEERELSEGEFKEQLKKQARNDQLVNSLLNFAFPDFSPGDTASNRKAPGQIRARMMLFSDSSTAHRVLEQLNQGTPWATLYDSYSRKFSFLGTHGDLGWFTWGRFARPLEYSLYKLPLYGISDPIEFKNYYALIHKTGTRLHPPGATVSKKSSSRWTEYRLRDYREKLMDLLKSRYTVKIPDSLAAKLETELKLNDRRES